jgi:hypothetical protein
MKNNRIAQALQNFEPSESSQEKMFQQILERSNIGNSNAVNCKRLQIKWLISLATCLILAIAVVVSSSRWADESIVLLYSNGNIKVNYVSNAPHILTSSDLVYLTEEEIITIWPSTIFYGTVKEIRNIKINFNGAMEYRAIAKIKVGEVYYGDVSKDDILHVLLPCPISFRFLSKYTWWVEDTSVISQLRIGMRGIFMPRQYSENDYWEQNDAKLVLSDIAEYGLPDGERFAFLETSNGLIYADFAFHSLPEKATLDDVRVLLALYLNQPR